MATNRLTAPFPGMDPFLELPAYWAGFHNLFINTLGDHLRERLLPAYLVRVEVEVKVLAPSDGDVVRIRPDIHIAPYLPVPAPTAPQASMAVQAEMVPQLLEPEYYQKYISIVDRTSRRVVTIIELLSPSNKPEPHAYREKRWRAFQAHTAWVELDLLRHGERQAEFHGHSDYYIMTHWGDPRADFQVWFLQLRDPLPTIVVSLAEDGSGIAVDLQAIFVQTYQRGALGYDIEYVNPEQLGLAPADTAWVAAQIAQSPLH